MRTTIFCGLVCLSSVQPTFAVDGLDQSYICQPTASGGLTYAEDQKRWRAANFAPGKSFVIKLKHKSADLEKTWNDKVRMVQTFAVTITEMGGKQPLTCFGRGKSDDVQIRDDNVLDCRHSLTDFRLNLKTNRFLDIYPIGYTDGIDSTANTPAITGGICTRID